MKQIRWFDRKFDFAFEQNIFPSIMERLKGTPILLMHKINTISNETLTSKPSEQWSIQENIGHLIDLEPLWQRRLQDILNNEKVMASADLENRKTEEAGHNHKSIADLLDEFTDIRAITMNMLRNITEKEVYKFALHPRLKTPMRIMDLFLFVAEHDDHHLASITKLNNSIND